MEGNDLLQRLCEDFTAKNAAALAASFHPCAVFEFPLAGQRLVGRREIENGLRRMFDAHQSVRITTLRSKSTGQTTIAQGRLAARRVLPKDDLDLPLGIVIESEAGAALRISLYCDAYGKRPWLDGAVFAAG